MTYPDAQANPPQDQGASTRRSRSAWLRWFGTLLAIGLLVYLLSQRWSDIVAAATQIAWWRFVLAFVLIMISRFAVAGRWHVLMHSAATGITPGQSIRLTFAMFFASNFLPTTIGGDAVRLAGAIRLGFDQAISLASLVADRLVGMTGMVMALPFGIPAYVQHLDTPLATSLAVIPWLDPPLKKIRKFLRDTLQTLQLWLKQPRSLLGALGFTWIHMLCTFGIIRLLLVGMGEHISFWLVMGLWSATYFVTLLPVSINGMGVQELAIALFYVALGGISQPSALTLALLMRVLPLIASLPGVLFIPDIMAGRK